MGHEGQGCGGATMARQGDQCTSAGPHKALSGAQCCPSACVSSLCQHTRVSRRSRTPLQGARQPLTDLLSSKACSSISSSRRSAALRTSSRISSSRDRLLFRCCVCLRANIVVFFELQCKCGLFLELQRGPQGDSRVAPGKSNLHSICKGELGIALKSLQGK